MGLRTASVRRPHVEVMAPALTETTQSQSFKLSSKDHIEPASPLNSSLDTKSYHIISNDQNDYCYKGGEDDNDDDNIVDLGPLDKQIFGDNNVSNLNILALVSETQQQGNVEAKCRDDVNKASDNDGSDTIMNNSQTQSMGDHHQGDDDKMGLEKNQLTESVSDIHSDNNKTATNANDVDQILNNLTAALPNSDVCSVSDLGQNDDDLMQVIKSIQGASDHLNNTNNDLNEEFCLGASDLGNNLTFEKLLNDVDMMNMNISMEEQQELDASDSLKESQSKDLIVELKNKLSKVERRLDFLRRKTVKLQARHMGQHVSSEIAGVFEYVNRSLKKGKDSTTADNNNSSTNNKAIESSIMNNVSTSSVSELNHEKIKPMSYGSRKTLLKKLEMTAMLQTNSASRHRIGTRYFGSGSLEVAPFRNNTPGMISIATWPMDYKQELQKVSGLLHTELNLVQHEIDSEATESSSGGESCDEMQNYNNAHQQYLSIKKRALWKYSISRAAIAARWTWLQAQISDLEYRIRQHKELHRKIRSTKGAVILDGPSPPSSIASSPTTVNGYRGQLPGSSPLSTKAADSNNTINGAHPEYQSARTRPLINFKKRKLLLTSSLHLVAKKAARPSTIRCGCVPPMTCAVCTGRVDPTHPRDPPETLSKAERIALLDPSFHSVISMPEDVSCGIHVDAIMKIPEFQQKCTRMKSLKTVKNDRTEKSIISNKNVDQRKKYNRVLKPTTASALSAKLKNKMRGRKPNSRHTATTAFRINNRKRSTAKVAMAQLQALINGADDEVESFGHNNVSHSMDSPSSSPLLHMQSISGYSRRNRSNSYDIDNIVIPYSVAASTRVEKLQYKEILTPKWRIADPDNILICDTKNNGIVRNPSQDSDAEDLSEEAVIVRHDKSEYDEKKKFLSYMKLPPGYGRPRAHKRTDSLAESSGGNTPDPMSPHPVESQDISTISPLTSPPATPLPVQTLLDDSITTSLPLLPSISAMRRRTISQSRFTTKEKDINREDNNTPENIEVIPFDVRLFPLDDDTYDKMLKNMPENHQFNKTNIRAQDSNNYYNNSLGYLDEKVGSPGSETTESALGDEDPNDPEWMDLEKSRDRHKR